MIYSKKILGSVIVGAALVASAGVYADESRDYDLASFDEISISAGIEADITVGKEQSIRVDADRRSELKKINIRVRNNKLIVGRDGSIFDWLNFGNADIKLTVSVPDLSAIASSAGADVIVSGKYGTQMTGSASSGASLEIKDLTADNVTLRASSGAHLLVDGVCGTLEARSSGGASLSADDLECVEVSARASSGANTDVYASGSIRARASSGGSIDVGGDPSERDVSGSTGGRIDVD